MHWDSVSRLICYAVSAKKNSGINTGHVQLSHSLHNYSIGIITLSCLLTFLFEWVTSLLIVVKEIVEFGENLANLILFRLYGRTELKEEIRCESIHTCHLRVLSVGKQM